MRKLSDYSTTDYLKVLVQGPSSVGKTVLACGFPTPIRYLDFDNKITSAAAFYANDKERLEKIEVIPYATMPVAPDANNKMGRMKQFTTDLSAIYQLHYAKKPLPFKTLVVDSLTTLVQFILDDYLKVSQTGIKRAHSEINALQDYQLLDKHMKEIITGLLSLECNVVFIGHIATEKDEISGSIQNKVLMPGKLADKLPIYFEEVWLAKVNTAGQYVLQTVSDSRTTCRTQRKLPKEVNSSYKEIMKCMGVSL